MKILVTGGAGFIGSNFCRFMEKGAEIVVLDKLTYCGVKENLDGCKAKLIKGDITDKKDVKKAMAGVNTIINFAAESHVDQSLYRPEEFVRTNILGTTTLLNEAMRLGVEKFIQVSTDEVYGSCREGEFNENSPLKPSSPYSASKAAADLLCLSYFNTYKFPVIITRCTNNYGPYQFPEKLIPLMISNALDGKNLPVYGDGSNVRDWIYVTDHCSAIYAALTKGKGGEIYPISGNNLMSNLEIVKIILKKLALPEDRIEFVNDRPGHDYRYALDGTKTRVELGWLPLISFESGMSLTIDWYIKNRHIYDKYIAKKNFKKFKKKNYGEK